MLECTRDNPMRVTDWRWRRAIGIAERTQPNASRTYDGDIGASWIRKGVALHRDLNRCRNEWDRVELSRKRPALFWAYRLYDDENAELKWEVEARLLAHCSDWEIGYACGLPPEVVEAYEQLFFNVRDKLRHRGYVLHCVIGPAVQRGLAERDYDLLWKLYGYFYGPYVIDSLTSKCVNPTWCPSADNAGAAIQSDAVGTMKLKAGIAAKTVRVDAQTQLELLNAFNQFVEIERTTDSSDKAQDIVLNHINAMMTILPFNIAGRNPRDNHRMVAVNPVHSFDSTAVELSFEETMKVSFGQRLPNERGLQALAFPQQTIEAELAGGNP